MAATEKPTVSVRIPVSGMTCAACQARVQRTLERQPGVASAAVNLMMKSATVDYDPAQTDPDHLVKAIRDTGYDAELPSPAQTVFDEQESRDAAQAEEFTDLRRKAIVSGVVGVIALIAPMATIRR